MPGKQVAALLVISVLGGAAGSLVFFGAVWLVQFMHWSVEFVQAWNLRGGL